VALSPERRSRLRQTTPEPRPAPQPQRPPAPARNIVPSATYGRKQRITSLTKDTVALLRVWLDERGGEPAGPLFPTSTGKPLTRKALARRIAKHATHAAQRCPSLTSKTITPHVLRHTAAMRLLHADVDTTVIALWLGHGQVETTQMYLHADLAIKERALARTKPLDSKPGRYRPPDAILGFLDGL
ncbi:MAG: tyrosine-type recombinase/integrase, partial [Solirubrobacteraceae bacterium]